jgi:hypothetical protein
MKNDTKLTPVGRWGNEVDDNARPIELAYRRGVHQALAMLQYYIKEEGVPADVALADAVEIASGIRGSRKAHGWLMHELLRKVHQRHAKRLAQATKRKKVTA